jgi:hypothetical protein
LNTVDLPTFGSPTMPTFMSVIVSSSNNTGDLCPARALKWGRIGFEN